LYVERIQKILEATCILKGVEPNMKEAEALLSESLIWMSSYNKDSVPDETLQKLKKYIINPEFTPSGINATGNQLIDVLRHGI
jgi:dynein heavy chain